MTPGLVAPHASSNAAPKLNGRIALGYYTGSQSSYAALVSFTPFMNVVSADIYTVRSDGSLVGSDDLGVAAFGRSHGIQTYACISNYNSDPAINNFDPKLAQAAIVTHKTQVISNLVALAQHAGFDGINIDFENLTYSANIDDARADFSSFIHDLAAQLHANGIKLIVSVPAKTSDSKDDIWSYPFDLAALGQDADYLQLMTYDQHSPSSAPGPISGADWVENCVVFTTSLVDPSRLLIGLPAYGYDWDLTASNPGKNTYSATNFSWTDIPTLFAKTSAEAQWDIGSQSPFVTYKENGHDHVAWYESAGSIQAKTKLLSEYNLAGFSVWSLGKEDQNFWQAARDGAK
jgi:spore germination protein YaaH